MIGEAERSGIAVWRRVRDDLAAEIHAGRLEGRLPSETELAERFGVNRHTLRRALAVLSREGLVSTRRGLGSFVAPPPERLSYPIGERTRFSANLIGQGRVPEGRLIGAERVAADRDLAAKFGCRPGAPLHRLETLHVADGVPLTVATGHFDAARFPGIVAAYAETGSITESLKREGCADYRRQETRITAERASPRDAEHLGLGPDAVVMVTLAVDVDGEGRPVQVLRTRFAADRIEFVVREPGRDPA